MRPSLTLLALALAAVEATSTMPGGPDTLSPSHTPAPGFWQRWLALPASASHTANNLSPAARRVRTHAEYLSPIDSWGPNHRMHNAEDTFHWTVGIGDVLRSLGHRTISASLRWKAQRR
ncbi:hypothetical protein DFH08DRAFT_964067 [Mycena albidolilacea]|uniref:Uncharacterized protein n=1 Tax=Mycena albidolilacea TaxID=1033008 RepID=A0AAD6ZUQ1_9AGAR|nr:hypothetical protein DFH08DRAFT_964067 [Mycena albidolilacea]